MFGKPLNSICFECMHIIIVCAFCMYVTHEHVLRNVNNLLTISFCSSQIIKFGITYFE